MQELRMTNTKIVPFLMNLSSEESCDTRMSISPIVFLIDVHSHGTPVQSTEILSLSGLAKQI